MGGKASLPAGTSESPPRQVIRSQDDGLARGEGMTSAMSSIGDWVIPENSSFLTSTSGSGFGSGASGNNQSGMAGTGSRAASRSLSVGSSSTAVSRSESGASSLSSAGLSSFLSNLSLWRNTLSSSVRERAQSLSAVQAQNTSRASGAQSASASLRENGTSEGQRHRDSLSDRDLSIAAAQELLEEAALSGLGLNRVYMTHSLPSHMWAVNEAA